MWIDSLQELSTLGTSLKKAFIQKYCPPSKTTKRLEDIHNFKQESDESLYKAWERYNDLLYNCPTHDINSHQKVNIFYKGLSTMNYQLLDLQGPIPEMTPTQALTAIQTIADNSQKWHDGTPSRSISSNSNTNGLAVIVAQNNKGRTTKVLQYILSPKEQNPGNFTLPCTIGDFNFYAMADLGVIDCFEEALDPNKDPMEKIFDYYKWVFDMKTEQLADEYELGIRKKGHILEMIWENCKNIQVTTVENELAQDGDFLDFFAILLYLEAKLKEVSCSNSTLPVYFISLMYNRDIVQTSKGIGVELSLDLFLPSIF
ncbi:hypothetical protein Tco_0945880 [Tanacetum coccineum]